MQIDEWRIKEIDTGHLSISHKSGDVARIFRSDGTIHGNVAHFNGWKTELGAPSCAYLSEKYLQIGLWRIGTVDSAENHLSVTHKSGLTAMIYRSDGTLHNGPRSDFNAWSLPDGPVLQGSADNCYAESMLQIGSNWRFAQVGNANHFSLSSDGQPAYTAQIFRSDGTLHPGPRTDFNAWTQTPTFSIGQPIFGDKAMQIDEWRIKEIDTGHLSISHKSGDVARIFRSDGTIHGNVAHFNGWKTELGAPSCAYLSEKYLQIGLWRIGTVDSAENHLSVTHKSGLTAMIYRSDGTLHNGPRSDFNAWSLPDGPVLQGSSENCNIYIRKRHLRRVEISS